MSVLKRFFKDTLVYGLAIVLPRLINFLLTKLHTDALPNESFSDNTYFYVYAALFNVVLTYGMETSFFRFFNKFEDKKAVLSTAFTLLLLSTSIIGLTMYLCSSELALFLGITELNFKILVAITVLETLIVIPFAYLRVTGRPIRFAIIKFLNVGIIVVLNVLLLSDSMGSEYLQSLFPVSSKVTYIFLAILIASVFVLLSMFPFMFKARLIIKKQIAIAMLNYGWPIMVAGVAFVINENFDKIYLHNYDKYLNGAYSACYKIAVFMTLFITAFKMGAEPFFFNHAKSENAKENYAKILKYFTIAGSIGLLVVCVYIDVIKSLIISNDSYLIAIDIVPFILLANLCLGIYHNLSIWYKLTDKTKYGMYISLTGAFITIILNIYFIPIFDYMACAYATLCAYGSMMSISYLLGRRHYKVPYDIKRIGFYILSSSLFAFLAFYIFDKNIWVGSGFLFLFLTLIYYLEKQDLQQLLNRKHDNKNYK